MNEQDVLIVEGFAVHVVNLIRNFIDELRKFKELPLSKQLQQRQNQVDESSHDWAFPNVRDQVSQASLQIESIVPDVSGIWTLNSFFFSLRNNKDKESPKENWTLMIHTIIHPLLASLGRCYQVLDSLPAPVLSQDDIKKKKSPLPPPGMLSLQNYTDIAVLLEFAVCIGILPLLEENILPPLSDRLQTIPKSLKGRMPLMALRYGASQRQQHTLKMFQRRKELLCLAALLGNLVHLDRFRPMLLPRHLTEIYAALFQAENLVSENETCAQLETSATAALDRIRFILLDDPKEMMAFATQRAYAFQQLLLQGRRGPKWLRKQVSALLNHLAITRLDAVLEVFVHNTMGDKSAAALRLARAITFETKSTVGGSKNREDYSIRLARQLLVVLDGCILRSKPQQGISANDVLNIEFIWMTLNNLSDDVVLQVVFETLVSPFGFSEADSTSDGEAKKGQPGMLVHQSIRRMEKLLSAAPSASVDRVRFCLLIFLRPIPNTACDLDGLEINILGLLIRLTGAQTVLANSAKEDAVLALRALVNFISSTEFSWNGKKVEGVDVAIASLVYSVIPTKWDLASMHFKFGSPPISSTNSGPTSSGVEALSSVTVELIGGPQFQMSVADAVENMQRYSKLVIEVIVSPFWAHRENLPPDLSTLPDMPSRMLEFLTVVYLRSEKGRGSSPIATSSSLVLAAMVFIPSLCEGCPMESLISTSTGQLRLLQLMRTTFDLVARSECEDDAGNSNGDDNVGSWMSSECVLFECLDCRSFGEKPGSGMFTAYAASAGFGVSLAVVLLDILACILELGKSSRPEREEQEIKSLMPPLERLAKVGVSTQNTDAGQWAAINEAASHLLPLIALRGDGETLRVNIANDENLPVPDKLRQADIDLHSLEPPLRARGVSSLRHLIVSEVLNVTASGPPRRMTVVSKKDDESGSDFLEDAFLLLLHALADKESYVYLGAIQTLAIAGCAYDLFHTIMAGIVNGSMLIKQERYEPSPEQRVKLAEVAISVLRRSPAILHDNAALVLNTLVYGKSAGISTGILDSLEIHKETLEYFEKAGENEGTDIEGAADWAEKKIRLNTGGPIFSSEEPGLVKSTMINLASETVTLAHPAVSSRCCSGLVDCAIASLQESSRLVRRSGALLARALYSAVVREMEDALVQGLDRVEVQCPLTLSMVKSKEDVLAAILRRVVLVGRDHLPDPATTARCEEALLERETAESGGILAAAQIVADKASSDNKFLVGLLTS